jgi:hypothetical protein
VAVTRKAKCRQTSDVDEAVARIAATYRLLTDRFVGEIFQILPSACAAVIEAAADRSDQEYLVGVFDFVCESRSQAAMSFLPAYPLTSTKLAKLPETTLPLCEDDGPDDGPGWTKMSLRGGLTMLIHTNVEGARLFFRPEVEDDVLMRAS